jgi:hypothetical protein
MKLHHAHEIARKESTCEIKELESKVLEINVTCNEKENRKSTINLLCLHGPTLAHDYFITKHKPLLSMK